MNPSEKPSIRRIARRALITGVIAAPLAASARWMVGCSDGTDPGEFDQSAMLRQLADNVMAPTLEELAVRTAALSTALDALAEGPADATLDAARNAWKAARSTWKQTQAFAFGPAEKLEPSIDWWPADGAAIDEYIAEGGPFDVSKFGANKKGFMALEYLLFDNAAGDTEILERLVGTASELAAALGADLAAQTAALWETWDPTRGGYADAYGNAGPESEFYKSPKDALDIVVNQMIFMADTAANRQVADPLGLKTGGTVMPELEESRRSDNSLVDLEDRIRGIDAVWEGRYGEVDGLGLVDMVKSRSEPLVGEVRSTIDAAYAAIDALSQTLRLSLTLEPDKVEALFEAIIEIKRVFGSDLVTVLGVTLTFNDNDGD